MSSYCHRRSRPEWTRKLDVSGRLLWYKTEDWTGVRHERPGFILGFKSHDELTKAQLVTYFMAFITERLSYNLTS